MEQFDPKYPCIYRVKLGYRVYAYLFALAAMGATGYLVADYSNNPKDDLISLVILICFMLPLGIYNAAAAASGRVTITVDAIEYRKFKTVRTIRREDLIGYRYHKTRYFKYVVLVSKSRDELTIDLPVDTSGYLNELLHSLPLLKPGEFADYSWMDPQQAQEALDRRPKSVDWIRHDD